MFVIRTKVWKINPVLADLRLSQENLCTLNFKLKHVNESGTLLYEHSTMNVDCGLHINSIWNPIFTHPSLWETTNPPSSPDRPWLTSVSFWLVPFLKKFQNSSISAYMSIMSPLRTSLPVYNCGSCNSTDEDPLIKTLGLLTWSSMLSYVNTQW